MRIAIDLTSLADNFSGIERFALNISKELITLDKINNYILIFKNSVHEEFKKFIDSENVEVKVLKGNKKLYFNQVILMRNLYKIKADRYLFFAFQSPILFRRKGIINTIHDLTPWDYPNTMKLLSKIYFKISILDSIKKSKEIITVSEFSKRRIKEKFNSNSNLIYCGISDVFLNKENNYEESEVILNKYGIQNDYLMCLCTLEPRKNIDILVKSFIELKDEHKISDDCKLVLVGRRGWKVEKLINEISSEYSKDIIVTGFVDDEDIPLIYKKSKCFVFPSLYEGFGIPVLEAMSMGTPVVASNTSAIPEVLGKDYKYMFENNNKEDLKKKILEMLALDKDELKVISTKEKEKSKEFCWRSEAEKVLTLLKR